MSKQALAVKFRPKTFEDVVEQDTIKSILMHQLDTDSVLHAYLFVGSAGTGKTTCARIFADAINKGQGAPIELDAASNNGVDSVRDIITQAKSKSLTSEYKIFIIDECHAISNAGWQAFLKLLEEPPETAIFIFCTTNAERIPDTILSRVQRYTFNRISQQGIVNRLLEIITMENSEAANIQAKRSAIEYIARISNGGMRNAISLLDKCLAYSTELTLENVLECLGSNTDEDIEKLVQAFLDNDAMLIISTVDNINSNGVDVVQFTKHCIKYVLDIFRQTDLRDKEHYKELLSILLKAQSEMKFDNSPNILMAYLITRGDV